MVQTMGHTLPFMTGSISVTGLTSSQAQTGLYSIRIPTWRSVEMRKPHRLLMMMGLANLAASMYSRHAAGVPA
jgi:hypothetical protein